LRDKREKAKKDLHSKEKEKKVEKNDEINKQLAKFAEINKSYVKGVLDDTNDTLSHVILSFPLLLGLDDLLGLLVLLLLDLGELSVLSLDLPGLWLIFCFIGVLEDILSVFGDCTVDRVMELSVSLVSTKERRVSHVIIQLVMYIVLVNILVIKTRIGILVLVNL
jgi:hypothetical protein